MTIAKRLEVCDGFTAAHVRAEVSRDLPEFGAGESGVAAALCHRSTKLVPLLCFSGKILFLGYFLESIANR